MPPKSVKVQRSRAERYQLVQKFKKSGSSIRKFAATHHIPCGTFRGWVNEDKAGKLPESLSSSQVIRSRTLKFSKVEERLVNYVNLHRDKDAGGKLGVSWVMLQEKALEFANQELGENNDFKASPGWCRNVLRRHDVRGTSHFAGDECCGVAMPSAGEDEPPMGMVAVDEPHEVPKVNEIPEPGPEVMTEEDPIEHQPADTEVDSAMLVLMDYSSGRRNSELLHLTRRLYRAIRDDRAATRSLRPSSKS